MRQTTLRERGVGVPEAVQVVGFDDQPLMDFIGLSTVRQPIAKLGRWAANAIGKRLSQPTAPVRNMRLQVELVPRQTTHQTGVDRHSTGAGA